MFSGGVDSTAALWHVLNNPDMYGEILVHHIHLYNVEGRWRAEAQAVEDILAYMRIHTSTPFTASDSTIAVPSVGKDFLYDTEVIGFITGYITSRDPSVTKVVIGVTGTDFEGASISQSVLRSRRLHAAFHGGTDGGVEKIYPHRDLTKQEVYDTLPLEVAKLTWSCRKPHNVNGRFIECGKCKTCRVELRRLTRKN